MANLGDLEDPDDFMHYIGEKFAALKPAIDTNWVIAIFTVVIALTGIAYTIFAGLQWSQMKAATRAAQDSANAALKSAEALRPRLAIANLTPSPPTPNAFPMRDGKLNVSFQVLNYGPIAEESAEYCEFDDVEEPSQIRRLPYGNCQPSSVWNFGNPVIPPVTGASGASGNGGNLEGSKLLTDDDIRGLKGTNPRLQAVFSIVARYKDAAGNPHQAESCILFTFQQNWGTTHMGAVTWGSSPCPWGIKND